MSISRIAKAQPWYHVTLPQCDAETKYTQERCINTATWESANGHADKVYMCKPHADRADIKMKPIRAKTVILRRD